MKIEQDQADVIKSRILMIPFHFFAFKEWVNFTQISCRLFDSELAKKDK
jgi:hypothetical protein